MAYSQNSLNPTHSSGQKKPIKEATVIYVHAPTLLDKDTIAYRPKLGSHCYCATRNWMVNVDNKLEVLDLCQFILRGEQRKTEIFMNNSLNLERDLKKEKERGDKLEVKLLEVQATSENTQVLLEECEDSKKGLGLKIGGGFVAGFSAGVVFIVLLTR